MHHPNPIHRRRLTVTGAVQGVGFRPFVYRLALDEALTGEVRNTPEGVVIHIQGPDGSLDRFAQRLQGELPPLARLVSLEAVDAEPVPAEAAFTIAASTAGHGHAVLISPDIATCDDCLADMADPLGRRFEYPFTNCTNCGPRYSITRSIPYDRPVTSMACFELCPECRAEYENPLDRRFHAQPNACPACGPRLWFTDHDGVELAQGHGAMEHMARALAQGRVAAIKGLGGFHLACDAASQDAVALLRTRKNRHGKPLAVMVPDLDTARAVARVNEHEAALLTGNTRPIVLLAKADGFPLATGPEGIAPDTGFVGVMLPYTPLHHILLRLYGETAPGRVPAPPTALVMTSGNLSSEPICLGNREALDRLGRIADCFLLHDRDILVRCDDSVVRVIPDGQTMFLRRARGYTPRPVFLPPAPKGGPRDVGAPTVLGSGPELKATCCLTKGDQAFVSQHLGDMENLDTLAFHHEVAAHLEHILQVQPELLVCDLHPDYMTTNWALEQERLPKGLPVERLQHHYAHALAVLAEHRFDGPALALALDGTGYGEDGVLWGGECLFVDSLTLERRRLAHFSPLSLPGGEAAIREPWRTAQAALFALGIRKPGRRPWPWLEQYDRASDMVGQMLERNLNCPATTSCGRLFDAVSGLLGICLTIDYEAQAAIRLEYAQDMTETGAYPCPLMPIKGGPAVLDTLALLRAVLDDWERGEAVGVMARRFHRGLVSGLADTAATMAQREGVTNVGLSGGVMQNLTLAVELPKALRERGLTPLSHAEVPPNDACVSLGQAVYGRRLLLNRRKA